jgi:hypothetical protein
MSIADKDIPAFSLAIVAFLVSLFGLYNTIRFAKRGNKAKVLTDLFTEFRTPQFNKIRRQLIEEYTKGQTIAFEEYREYSFFLNHIGLLLHQGYVDIEDIYQFIGTTVINAWKALSPAIMDIRANGAIHYQFHFQYLAAQLMEHKQAGDKEIGLIMSKSDAKIKKYSQHS